MTYLLDTCTFIWLCAQPDQLSEAVGEAIDASDSAVILSDVSAMEIALKWSAGKLSLPDPPRHWIEEQSSVWSIKPTSLSRDDIYRASELPDHHRDPFDRLLVAAALNRSATILTPDEAIHRYPASCRW